LKLLFECFNFFVRSYIKMEGNNCILKEGFFWVVLFFVILPNPLPTQYLLHNTVERRLSEHRLTELPTIQIGPKRVIGYKKLKPSNFSIKVWFGDTRIKKYEWQLPCRHYNWDAIALRRVSELPPSLWRRCLREHYCTTF
jgi:hypothetical protein